MVTKKKYGSAKRFGARYGRKIRAKIAKVEEAKALSKTCPYCRKNAVKRIAVGIWQCRSCKSKFTGRAYTIVKPATFEKETVVEETEEHAEHEEDEEPASRAPEKIAGEVVEPKEKELAAVEKSQEAAVNG